MLEEERREEIAVRGREMFQLDTLRVIKGLSRTHEKRRLTHCVIAFAI